MHKILLLDDEENILNSLKRMLRHREDWELETHTSPAMALNRVQCNLFDVMISDLKMPEMNGIEFFMEAKQQQPDAMRIMLTGFVDPDHLMEAINKAHVFGFITKPWDEEQLINVIERAIDHRKVVVENRMLANRVREQQEALNRYQSMAPGLN